jgi:magnesium transporter
MIRICVFNKEKVIKDVDASELKKHLRKKGSTVWVDLESPSEEEYKLILEDTFNFHPLSIEDCKTPLDLPKVDVFPEYFFLVFHSVSVEAEKGYFKKWETDFFVGDNFIVSVHLHKSPSADALYGRVGLNGSFSKAKNKKVKAGTKMTKIISSPDFVMYHILDHSVERYFPLLDTWDDYVEEIEMQILRNKPSKHIINKMISVKREMLDMRKSIIPQRDVINKMTKASFPFIKPKTAVYLRDVFDRIMLVYTELEIQRDLINSALDAHMSIISNQMNQLSNKMNEVMKKLTIIATIFMPLTFLTGLYGMNFEHLPGAAKPYGFFMFVIVCLAVLVLMMFYFRKKKWL